MSSIQPENENLKPESADESQDSDHKSSPKKEEKSPTPKKKSGGQTKSRQATLDMRNITVRNSKRTSISQSVTNEEIKMYNELHGQSQTPENPNDISIEHGNTQSQDLKRADKEITSAQPLDQASQFSFSETPSQPEKKVVPDAEERKKRVSEINEKMKSIVNDKTTPKDPFKKRDDDSPSSNKDGHDDALNNFKSDLTKITGRSTNKSGIKTEKNSRSDKDSSKTPDTKKSTKKNRDNSGKRSGRMDTEDSKQESEQKVYLEDTSPKKFSKSKKPNYRTTSPEQDVSAEDEIPKRGTTNERKEYNLYEDWRIMETIAVYISREGAKGIMSKNYWAKIKDPKTKKILLGGSRTSESMRERYKRYINILKKENVAQIRKFVRENGENEEELRKHFLVFQKIDDIRAFTGITKEQLINVPKRNTPYNVKPPKLTPEEREAARIQREREKSRRRAEKKRQSAGQQSNSKNRMGSLLEDQDIQEIADIDELERNEDPHRYHDEEEDVSQDNSFARSFFDDEDTPLKQPPKSRKSAPLPQIQKEKLAPASIARPRHSDVIDKYAQQRINMLEKQLAETTRRNEDLRKSIPMTLDTRLRNQYGESLYPLKAPSRPKPQPEPVMASPEPKIIVQGNAKVTRQSKGAGRPSYIIVKTPELPKITIPPPKIVREMAVNTDMVRVPDYIKGVDQGCQAETLTVAMIEQAKKKRKGVSKEREIIRPTDQLKHVKTNDYYEKRALQTWRIFDKRATLDEFRYNENLTVFVDRAVGMRFALDMDQIVDDRVYEGDNEAEDNDNEIAKLKALARDYNVDFKDLLNLYKRVSLDFDDLYRYLKTGDDNLLWNDDLDRDLIENDETALRYIRQYKGQDRIHKRLYYLQTQGIY